MIEDKQRVSLAMGGGGKQMQDFIKDIIMRNFANDILSKSSDSAYIPTSSKSAFTSDSFIIKPEFFNGGNIGKLSICGTVNDLAVSGAIPKYLSFSLIIPEGYLVDKLEEIIISTAEMANIAGVNIVTGDTKVMPYGMLDSVVINTSGVGDVVKNLIDFSNISVGDKVIVSSDIARHGMCIMLQREDLGFIGDIKSDCACLNKLMQEIYHYDIKFARDATRGGLSAVLNEIKDRTNIGFMIDEKSIPVMGNVKDIASTLGFDILSVANEGVAVIIVSEKDAEDVLNELRKNPLGRCASIIGDVTSENSVILNTIIGGKRYVEMPSGELLPRIC